MPGCWCQPPRFDTAPTTSSATSQPPPLGRSVAPDYKEVRSRLPRNARHLHRAPEANAIRRRFLLAQEGRPWLRSPSMPPRKTRLNPVSRKIVAGDQLCLGGPGGGTSLGGALCFLLTGYGFAWLSLCAGADLAESRPRKRAPPARLRSPAWPLEKYFNPPVDPPQSPAPSFPKRSCRR